MVTSAQVVETSVTTTDTVLLSGLCSPLTIRLYYHRFSILRSFGKVWNRATSKFGTQAYLTQGYLPPLPPPSRFAPQKILKFFSQRWFWWWEWTVQCFDNRNSLLKRYTTYIYRNFTNTSWPVIDTNSVDYPPMFQHCHSALHTWSYFLNNLHEENWKKVVDTGNPMLKLDFY